MILALILLSSACLIPIAYFWSRRDERLGFACFKLLCALCLALSLVIFIKNQDITVKIPYVLGLGFSLRLDGFRRLFITLTSFMFLISGLFAEDYLKNNENKPRYILFSLLTLYSVLGVFMADDFITLFVFFEIMSFASYPLVVHEGNEKALSAGKSYLSIAIFGGMSILMGLFLLNFDKGYSFLGIGLSPVIKSSLIPALLMLAGFGAKAGLFPLHVWLPKAHPVAPAPASALLSGVLTKTGVFGIIALTHSNIMSSPEFLHILLIVSLLSMLIGALIALFSLDLKETLAASSMSQIGFICLGIALSKINGVKEGYAAFGAIWHMLNHSLVKLTLFLAAGAVYMETHELNINKIKGFGRKKPLLLICFIIGIMNLAGIPGSSGYISKTLLHEGIIEQIHLMRHSLQSPLLFQAAEIVFMVSGGLTLCYMLKLFICIFIEKGNEIKENSEISKKTAKPRLFSRLLILIPALILIALGVFWEQTLHFLKGFADFLSAGAVNKLHAYSLEGLKGAGISLAAGIALYLIIVRKFIVKNGEYTALRPKWLEIENSIYMPLTRAVRALCVSFSRLFAFIPDKLFSILARRDLVYILTKAIAFLPEFILLNIARLIFRDKKPREAIKNGNRLTNALGKSANRLSGFICALHEKTPDKDYSFIFGALYENIRLYLERMSHSLSLSLMMFSIGLIIFLIYTFLSK